MSRVRPPRPFVAYAATAAVLGLALTGWAYGAFSAQDAEAKTAASQRPSASASATPTATPTPTPTSAPLSAAQQAQTDYALTYWQNYNTAQYGDDNPNGGDCANFVSQTLIARGWTMNSQWYNHGQGAMSAAWAYVPSMWNYFQRNAQQLGLVQLGEGDRAQYAVGDVVMFWWQNADGSYSASPDHVQVIDRLTGTGATTKVEMASHNEDYPYRDLDDEITKQHPGAKFVVWHLTRDTN